MGAFALPLAIVAGGLQAYSAFSDASAAKGQAKAQSQIAANNAIIANNNAAYQDNAAKDALARGQEDKKTLRRKLAQIEGTQRAGFGAAGVTLDTGSPLDILSDTNTLANEDISKTLENSKREALGYKMGAYNYRATGANDNAESSMYASKAKGINPLMSAAGSALSSAASISSKWDTFGSGSTPSAANGSYGVSSSGLNVGQSYAGGNYGYGTGVKWN